jgi:hypothetical protein
MCSSSLWECLSRHKRRIFELQSIVFLPDWIVDKHQQKKQRVTNATQSCVCINNVFWWVRVILRYTVCLPIRITQPEAELMNVQFCL